MMRMFEELRNTINPTWHSMGFKDYNCLLPDKNTFAPRDTRTQNFSDNKDMLFLAGLISGNYDNMVFHFQKDGKPVFLREKEGKYYHPFLDMEVNVDESYILKSKISKSTLRKKFRERFLYMRKKIHDVIEDHRKTGKVKAEESYENIYLGQKTIKGRDATIKCILYVEKRIKPSIEIGNDPFIHRFNEQPLLNFEMPQNPPPKTLICPYHGPVKPKFAFRFNAGKSVKYKEGYALCPKCYGTLSRKRLAIGF